MKTNTLFAFTLAIVVTINAYGQSLSFTQGIQENLRAETEPVREFRNGGASYCEITYYFTAANISEVKSGRETYQYLHIDGFSAMNRVGAPALPAHNEIIAMPRNSTGRIVILESDYAEYQGYMIHPALEPQSDGQGISHLGSRQDERIYASNSFFPEDIVEIVEVAISRGTPLAIVQVRPVQFNPVTKIVRVYSKIRYRIEFENGVSSFDYIAQENTNHYTNLLKLSVINSESIPNGISVDSIGSTRGERSGEKNYIIITHSQYVDHANQLANWKRQLDFTVEVVSQDSWTAEQVKTAIHTRYYNWNPRPDYFVIIGDHDGSYAVPAEVHENPEGVEFATDLYYACMDGEDDWYPDMAHGRISVSCTAEATTVVNKIINYEQYPETSSAFYDNILFCAQYQDENNNGWEDARYCCTCEEIRDYLQNEFLYTSDRVYYTNTTADITTLKYNGVSYCNGGLLPSELRNTSFNWDGNSSDITSSINAGKFLVIHRDHGLSGGFGWAHPTYTTTSLENLSNGARLPVVFSLNCHTGAFLFDNCFAEKFTRMANKGAIGVVAASCRSMSGYNDAIAVGMIDAIWANPGIFPQFGSGGTDNNYTIGPGNEIYTMGDVLNQGLTAMVQNWDWTLDSNIYTHEMFHWFGDPAMKIWTSNPNDNPITAVYLPFIYRKTAAFAITNSTPGAIATLLFNNELVGKTVLDDSGNGSIPYTIIATGNSAVLTISKHNHKPLVSNLNVIDHDYAVASVEATPEYPVEGQQVTITAEILNAGVSTESPGQNIQLFIDGQLFSNIPLPGLQPGVTTQAIFTWAAVNGPHNLKVHSLLNGDQNNANDIMEIPINVTTAGSLLIDGSIEPVKYHNLSSNSQQMYQLELYNPGEASVSGSITKSGTVADWLTLTGGTDFSLYSLEYQTYNYTVTIPEGIPEGIYAASITFNYGSGQVMVSLNIYVSEEVEEIFTQDLIPSSGIINANQDYTIIKSDGDYFLDNYDETPYPVDRSQTYDLALTDYYRANYATWIITADEQEQSEDSGLQLKIVENGSYSVTLTNDVINNTYGILEWLYSDHTSSPTNTFRTKLNNYIISGDNVIWYVDESKINIYLTQSAWGAASSCEIPQSQLDAWEEAYDYLRIYFTVSQVNNSGYCQLYNNGKYIAQKIINSEGEDYFSLSLDDLSTSNYFNIKGKWNDDTYITINNIYFKGRTLFGDPIVECQKSLSQSIVNVNQNVITTLDFENTGSNVATEIYYNDAPLPAGIALVSGSLSGYASSLDPGDTDARTYTIKPSNPGYYSFGANNVTYENQSGSDTFTSTFNAVNLTVSGGTLLITGSVSDELIGQQDTVTIKVVVKGSILDNPVSGATVSCIVTKPDNTSISFNLIWNETDQNYSYDFAGTDLNGNYVINITAQCDFYNNGTLDPPKTFKVGAISVLSPSGGESWAIGAVHVIYWWDNVDENVRIELLKGGALNLLISNSSPSDGEFSWLIPGDQPIGSDYQIRVSSTDDFSLMDESDGYFSIISPALTVLSPNGLETYQAGSYQDINWSANFSDSVRIELYKGGVFHSLICNSTDNDGSYHWLIPAELALGSDYKVRIIHVNDPLCFDQSDADFSIIQANEIEIITPNGGEAWVIGSSYLITWIDNFPENVIIELYKSGMFCETIISSTESDGSYLWIITFDFSIGTDYKIKIRSQYNENCYSQSAYNFSLLAPSSFICGDAFIDSRDAQSYSTVQIGDQCWMAENLNIGTKINSTSGGYQQTDNDTIEKYCYNNDTANCTVYGGLYEWPEAMQYITTEGAQGICPEGWHIPTDNEWKILEGTVDSQYGVGHPVWDGLYFRGYDAGGNLKEAGTAHWSIPNTGATNSSGFTGLPGGFRSYYDGDFNYLGSSGYFWSSSQSGSSDAWNRTLEYGYFGASVYRDGYSKEHGFSVRCIKDCEPLPTQSDAGPDQLNLPGTSTLLAGNVPIYGTGVWRITSGSGGFVADTLNPTSLFQGQAGNTYILAWIISNACGDNSDTVVISFAAAAWQCGDTIEDARDEQSYNTVLIGEQCWMAENLNIGTKINSTSGGSLQMDNDLIEKYCYGDNLANCAIYGGLYEWPEAMQYETFESARGICPNSWHIPSDNEWKILEGTLDSQYSIEDPEWDIIGWRGLDAGSKLKEAGYVHWQSPNTGASNESGFTAFPGGFRNNTDGIFTHINKYGYFWSSTNAVNGSWSRGLGYLYTTTGRWDDYHGAGLSVRCLKDCEPQPPQSDAGPNQLNIPGTFTILTGNSPAPGIGMWHILSGTGGIVDDTLNPISGFHGQDGILYSLTWTISTVCGVSQDTVLISFATSGQPCPDVPTLIYEGQTYNTVLNGTQCWLKENLNVGVQVSNTINPTDNGVIEKFCYGNNGANCSIYGGLYQWNELMQYGDQEGTQGICPSGWHIPTDSDFCQLLLFLDPTIDCDSVDGWNGTDAGAKMKETGTAHWYSPNQATNLSNMTVLGGGRGYYDDNHFTYLKERTWLWSSTISEFDPSRAWTIYMNNEEARISRSDRLMNYSYSVRCMKDCTPQPIQANAGPDQVIPFETSTILAGNTPFTGVGVWHVLTGPGGTIADTLNPVSSFTGLSGNTYSLSWSIITLCGSSSDTVKISFAGEFQDCGDMLVDVRDNQVYTTLQIGDQCWMTKNLNTGVMVDGLDPDAMQSDNDTIEKYCYDNLEVNCELYGGMYDWGEVLEYTGLEGAQGICPEEWHVPTDGEWTALVNYLGGMDVAGGKLKEEGYNHWQSPNTGATNESGFTALPGGYIFGCAFSDPAFSGLGNNATFHTSSESEGGEWTWDLDYSLSSISHNPNNLITGCFTWGRSLRCIQSIQININAPAGGDIWYRGNDYEIEWTDNIESQVKIELYKAESYFSTIANSTLSDGSYLWPVSLYHVPGNDYQIKVTSLQNPQIFAMSGIFSIRSEGELFLIITPDTLTLENDTYSSDSFEIISNVSWTITEDAHWLDVSMSSGYDHESVTVTANSENTSSEARIAAITITGEGEGIAASIVTVVQEGSGLSDCILVAEYTFTDGSGDDFSGNAHHGSLYGPLASMDRFYESQNALTFDGVDDYVWIGGVEDLKLQEFTLSAWFRTTVTATDMKIYRWRWYGSCLRLVNGTVSAFVHPLSGAVTVSTAETYNDGEWHHVALTCDSSFLKLYIDKELKDTEIIIDPIFYGPEGAAIGRDGDNPDNYYQGELDDFRVMNCAYDESEVRSLYYENYYSSLGDSISHYYRFDGDLTDYVGSVDGSNFATTDQTSGVINHCRGFNGTSGCYVDTYNNSAFNFLHDGSDFTISVWEKHNSSLNEYMSIFGNSVGSDRRGACLRIYGNDVQLWIGRYPNPYPVMNNTWTNCLPSNTTQWNHLVLTHSSSLSSNQYSLYVNGSLVGTASRMNECSSGDAYYSMKFGINKTVPTMEPFEGSLDELSFWNRCLSVQEVAELYLSGDGIQYPFNDTVPFAIRLPYQVISTSDDACINAYHTVVFAGNGDSYTVSADDEVDAFAGSRVLLKPGFHALPGSYFHAWISDEGCMEPLKPVTVITASDDRMNAGDIELTDIMGVGEMDQKDYLKVYPNPTTGKLNIEIHSMNPFETNMIFVYDFHGRVIDQQEMTGPGKTEADLSTYPHGMYLIRVIHGLKSETVKVVKQY